MESSLFESAPTQAASNERPAARRVARQLERFRPAHRKWVQVPVGQRAQLPNSAMASIALAERLLLLSLLLLLLLSC